MVNIRPFFYKYMSLQLTYLSGLDICEYVSECGACEYLPTNLESSYVYYCSIKITYVFFTWANFSMVLLFIFFMWFFWVHFISNSMLKLLYGAQGIRN